MLTEQLDISKTILLQEILFNSQFQLLFFTLHFSKIILNKTTAYII